MAVPRGLKTLESGRNAARVPGCLTGMPDILSNAADRFLNLPGFSQEGQVGQDIQDGERDADFRELQEGDAFAPPLRVLDDDDIARRSNGEEVPREGAPGGEGQELGRGGRA